MSLIAYLRLGRINLTGFLVILPPIIYAVAGGNFWSLTALELALFGLLYQYNGFILNDYWDRELDRKDNKYWRPLVNGSVSETTVKWLIVVLSIICIAIALSLANSIGSIIALILAVVCGTLYNYTKARTCFSFIFSACAFSFLILFPYIIISKIDDVIVLLMLYTFFHVVYQIGYSGNYIDIRDSKNFIKLLGTKVKNNRLLISTATKLFGYVTKIITFIIGLMFWWVAIPSNLKIFFISVYCILYIIIFYVVQRQLASQDIDRSYMSKNIVIVELLSFYAIMFMLYPLIGTIEYLLFIIFPPLWFFLWNPILWGKSYILSPKV